MKKLTPKQMVDQIGVLSRHPLFGVGTGRPLSLTNIAEWRRKGSTVQYHEDPIPDGVVYSRGLATQQKEGWYVSLETWGRRPE